MNCEEYVWNVLEKYRKQFFVSVELKEILKQGHRVKSWRTRRGFLLGPTFSYFDADSFKGSIIYSSCFILCK